MFSYNHIFYAIMVIILLLIIEYINHNRSQVKTWTVSKWNQAKPIRQLVSDTVDKATKSVLSFISSVLRKFGKHDKLSIFKQNDIGQDVLNRDIKDQVNIVRDMYKNSIFQDQPDIPNFGGSTVLAVKNLKNNGNSKLAVCKDLGFGILGKDHDKYQQSLVKLVEDKVVTIHSCTTHTSGDPYGTKLDIENNSNEKVEGLIPAGSVVAEQNQFRKVQNLCSQQDYRVTLGPHQRNTFDVPSFCMDVDYECPDGESANFTPLMYQNMPSGMDQSAFWKWSNQFRK